MNPWHLEQRFNRLKSLLEEEISRVSEVMAPEQKEKYQSDLHPAQLEQKPAATAAPEHK